MQLKPTHRITFSVPTFDDGDVSEFDVALPRLTADAVVDALTMFDAQNSGTDSAGYEMMFFAEETSFMALFVVRTRGLGPGNEVYGHGTAMELTR